MFFIHVFFKVKSQYFRNIRFSSWLQLPAGEAVERRNHFIVGRHKCL